MSRFCDFSSLTFDDLSRPLVTSDPKNSNRFLKLKLSAFQKMHRQLPRWQLPRQTTAQATTAPVGQLPQWDKQWKTAPDFFFNPSQTFFFEPFLLLVSEPCALMSGLCCVILLCDDWPVYLDYRQVVCVIDIVIGNWEIKYEGYYKHFGHLKFLIFFEVVDVSG